MTEINHSPLTIGLIGVGKIGGSLINGWKKSGFLNGHKIIGTTAHPETREKVKALHDITIVEDNRDLVKQSDIVLIAVKPSNVRQVCREIGIFMLESSEFVSERKLLISISSGITMELLKKWIGGELPIIRVMPNLPCRICEGLIGFSYNENVKDEQLVLMKHLFTQVGLVIRVDEELLDAVTGLGASGPAFIYIIIESLSEAGVKVGLSREKALLIAAQMVQGAARMVLGTNEHPARLKDEVTTPAGTTIDGIMELEEGKLRVTLIKAIVKATERAKELSQIFGGNSD